MSAIDDMADLQTVPARGSADAKRWIAARVGWPTLGVEIDRVVVDGHEPGSSVTLYLSTGRRITLTISDLFSRPRFQATLGAALHYGAPLLKQDALNDVAGAILGLASVDEIYSSPQAANEWGLAYVLSVGTVPYDNRPDADAASRFRAISELREEAAENRRSELAPPRKALACEADGALLVVRSWFHYEVAHHLAPGDRGLSPQRIATMMRGEGWGNLAPTHSKLSAGVPQTRKTVSLNVYHVPAGYGQDTLDEDL